MKLDITEYLPFGKLTDVKVKWMQMTFEDYERELKEPEQIFQSFKDAYNRNGSTVLIEWGDYYAEK